MEKKRSEILYQEIKELEKKVLKIKLTSKQEAKGKCVREIYTDKIEYWDPVIGNLIVFTDDTALFIEGRDVKEYLHFIWRSHWNDFNNTPFSCRGEEIDFFLQFKDKEENPLYVNLDVLDEIIAKAEEYETAKHQEDIKENIQRHLDEISKLKEQL